MSELFPSDIILNKSYESILPRFMELRLSEIGPMGRAIEKADFAALKAFGHNLHGTGSSYGLEALSQLGTEMESAAKNEDRDTLIRVYAEISGYLHELKISYRNTILFVDDQQEVITLLKRLFVADEYICYFANSGAEALEILDQMPVDVLVSDLVMPDMGGLELLSIVRNRFPKIVRLVLSGQSQVPSILAAINAGHVFRYLTKPWRVDAEARAVISEAVAYANEINHQQSHLNITLDVLTELLALSGKHYLLLGRENRIVMASSGLPQKWVRGQHADAQELDQQGGESIALDSVHTLRIWD